MSDELKHTDDPRPSSAIRPSALAPQFWEWHLPGRVLRFEWPLVMAILNLTPDSFSDGGSYPSTEAAVARGLECARQGADLLDIGGESTRPGAVPVPVDEELARVLPVVRALHAQTDIPLSIDTSKAEVARACLEAGASIINDISALIGDPGMPDVVLHFRAGVILMHMQGTPQTMQIDPHYDDVVRDISAFLEERLQHCVSRGIARERIVLDPGIGFGKTRDHNLEILARLHELQNLAQPVCLGVSRKGFLGRLLGDRPVTHRLASSLAAACHAMGRHAVQVLRVHDVEETCDAVTVFKAIGRHGA
jgi:dihydropteroate synthase